MNITTDAMWDEIKTAELREINFDTVLDLNDYVDNVLFSKSRVDYFLRTVYSSISYVNMYYYFEFSNMDISFIFKVGRLGDKVFTDYYSAEYAYLDKNGETILHGPYVIEGFEEDFKNKVNKIIG